MSPRTLLSILCTGAILLAISSCAARQVTRTFTIGPPQGEFPGMLCQRTFHVVFVNENKGAGIDPVAAPDRVVRYDGQSLTVRPPD